MRGTPTYLDGRWQGFTSPMDVTIDLGAVTELSHIFAKFMQERVQWVYMPGDVEILLSDDGVNFRSVARQKTHTSEDIYKPVFETFSFPMKERARYVRVKASNTARLGTSSSATRSSCTKPPDSHSGYTIIYTTPSPDERDTAHLGTARIGPLPSSTSPPTTKR